MKSAARSMGLLLLVAFLVYLPGGSAEGCPDCWSGYGSGDEQYNKPLAAHRQGLTVADYLAWAMRISSACFSWNTRRW